MKIRNLAAAAAVAALFMIGPAWAAEFTMKIGIDSAPFPEDMRHYRDTPIREFIKEVNEKSGGRIEAVGFWNGQLGKIENTLKLVSDGLVEAQIGSDGQLAPYCPQVQVFSIPYLFIDRKVAYEVLDGDFGQNLADSCAKESGIRPIWLENGGYRNFTANKPLNTVEDMKGLKVRTMTIPVHMEIVKALGATATPIPWADLYVSLQTGVVDGEENSLSTFRAAKLEEVQKHIILDGHVYGVAVFALSQKWLDSLPDDLRAVVEEAAVNMMKNNREISVENEQTDREYLESKGVTIVDPPLEEKAKFQKMSQGPALELIKGTVDAELLDDLMAAVGEAEAKL